MADESKGPDGFGHVAADLLKRSSGGLLVHFSPTVERSPGVDAWFPGTHPFVVVGLLESLMVAVSRAVIAGVASIRLEPAAGNDVAVEFLTYAEAVDLLFHVDGPECLAFAGLRPMEKGDGFIVHVRLKGQPDLLASRLLQLKQLLLRVSFADHLDAETAVRILDGQLDELPFGRESLVFAQIGATAVHADRLLGKAIPALAGEPRKEDGDGGE